MEPIHDIVRSARERKGWSMDRLAKEVSKAEGLKKPLSWQTVQQWENGTSQPRLKRLVTLMEVLEVSPPPHLFWEPKAQEEPPRGYSVGDAIRPEAAAALRPVRNAVVHGITPPGLSSKGELSKRATILAMMFDEMADGPFKEKAYILCQQVMLGFDPQTAGSTALTPRTEPAGGR